MKQKYNQIALKGGSYSLAMTGIVLAILVVVNIFASILPAAMTQYEHQLCEALFNYKQYEGRRKCTQKGCDNLLDRSG